jgi:flagellar hook assembly protein FlgD
VLADGPYQVTLAVSDAAGNSATQAWLVALDTAKPTVKATLTQAAISPNGDGWADGTVLGWTSDAAGGQVQLMRGSRVIRTWPKPGVGTGSLAWDGRDAANRGVADGSYTLRLTLADAAGNQVVTSLPVIVDRTAGFLRWSPTRFNPKTGSSTVTFTLTRSATTSLVIRGPNGKTVRTAWSGRAQKAGTQGFTWNGRDAANHLVAAGSYVAVLTVRSGVGTVTVQRTVIVK